MKTIGLGIVIGAAFKGASAFTNVFNSTSLLNSKLKDLESRKVNLSSKFGATSAEVSKLNTKILALSNNLNLLEKTKVSFKNIEAYRNKFKSSIMDKVALGGTIAMPFKFAIDFESAMADVKKVVNFGNENEAKTFEKSLLSLSKTIPLSATELATISASGGQLGIAKENLLQFTTTVAKMSTAFDMSAESAGDSIAKLMNIYGLTQTQVVELGDSINHLSDTSASKAKDIVEVLGRVGGVAKIFGLTTVQTGALSSAFLALGKPPEVAATSINALLLKLKTADKQNKSFQEGLDAIGLSAKGVKNSIEKDAQGGLISFLKTLQKVPKKEQMGVLSDLFGAEYADDIALLVGGLDNYTQALEATADKTKYLGSMQKEFETRSATTQNNLKLLGNTASAIAINFGSLLLPALNAVITRLRIIGEKVGDFVTKFPILSQVLGIAVVGVIALSIGFSALGYMSSFVIGGLLNIGKTLLFVNTLFLANPIVATVAAIALAAGLIYTYWEPIKTFMSEIWNNPKQAFEDFLNLFKSGIEFIKPLWNEITSIFGGTSPVLATTEILKTKTDNQQLSTGINPVEPIKLDNQNASINKSQNVNIQKIEINNPASTAEVEKGVAAGLKSNATSLSDKEF